MSLTAQSVGIDVSKDSLDIHILAKIGHSITGLKVANTTLGIKKLENALLKYQVSKQTPIVVESTGDYHILSVLQLNQKGWDIRLINPLISGKINQSTVRKVKTDKVDAMHLAELGIRELERLPRFTGNKEQVVIGKKLSLIHTLEKKQEAMRKSVKSTKMVIKQIKMQTGAGVMAVEEAILSLRKAIKQLKKEIVDVYRNDPDLQRIDRIPGVSTQNGSMVLSCIKGKDFKDKQALVAFSGLDVSVRQSGKYCGRTKLTKRGNAYLRHILFSDSLGIMETSSSLYKIV